jgi:hypothetical protein
MLDTYPVLLRLGLRHHYFPEEVVLTPASAERLRRAGWLLKAQTDGLVLLGGLAWGQAANGASCTSH